MAAFVDVCPECGREYTNYDDRIAYRPWCSVVCEVRRSHAAEQAPPPKATWDPDAPVELLGDFPKDGPQPGDLAKSLKRRR